MPWCPKCRSEYDRGVKVCNDCQCDLVDELSSIMQPARESFLLTVADEMEYRIVESKLGQYAIPVTMRFRGAGAVTHIYMGRTFGLDVYVPEVALAQAKEIMADAVGYDQDEKDGKADGDHLSADISRKRKWGKKILLICIIIGMSLLGFFAVMYLIAFLHLI